MSTPSPKHNADRATLLAELAQVSGRDDVAVLMAAASNDDIRDDITDRRQALAFIERHGRLAAIWQDDRALVVARHDRHARQIDGGDDTVVALGPCVAFNSPDRRQAPADLERHGRHNDGGEDTVVVFGPSLEIPFNRG